MASGTSGRGRCPILPVVARRDAPPSGHRPDGRCPRLSSCGR
ncbi:hypothetical protein DVS28_a2757 [Euzebya pacifica]|uniref:Uncharacterized protein n=1 Tax=Euzebya pacifica TaxID=1608957 RepID=A0A346XYY9_9ACTN|nr:hypothetical protein DVS28_a2757 [Euzebya pacifica]